MRALLNHRDSIVLAAQRLALGKSNPEVVQALKEKLRQVQTWFFDLDDTHAPSPARKLALRAAGTSYLSPAYIKWSMETAYKRAAQGKAAETEAWCQYREFLRNDDTRHEITAKFTAQYARSTLYPGVADFCGLYPDAQKFYISRNIKEVAQAYAHAHGFTGCMAEADAKDRAVEQYILKHPEIERYAVEGDSEEDEEMVEMLHYYRKDAVGIYVMEKKDAKVPTSFLIATSRDRSGLVELLK